MLCFLLFFSFSCGPRLCNTAARTQGRASFHQLILSANTLTLQSQAPSPHTSKHPHVIPTNALTSHLPEPSPDTHKHTHTYKYPHTPQNIFTLHPRTPSPYTHKHPHFTPTNALTLTNNIHIYKPYTHTHK